MGNRQTFEINCGKNEVENYESNENSRAKQTERNGSKFQEFIHHPIDHLFHVGKRRESLAHDWSYEGECGPQTWPKYFSGAKGKHQSPINIETRTAVFADSLLKSPLRIVYEAESCSQIKNTGHSFQVDGFPFNKSCKISSSSNKKNNEIK